MRFKVDENLPHELCDVFAGYGHDTDTVADEGLKSQPDGVIWPAAVAANRALITSDLDFSDIRSFQPGTHPGLVLFWVHAEGRAAIIARFEEILASYDANDWSRCFVVITAEKIRIRRPISETSGDSDA